MFFTRKRIYASLGAALVVAAVGGYTAWRGHGDVPVNAPRPRPTARRRPKWTSRLSSRRPSPTGRATPGRLEAIDKVDIRPLVPGTIVAVHFKDGALVKKGDPLFTIDPRPYVAEVDRAAAQVAAAQARNGYTSTDAARAERLLADNAIAKRDYDEKQNASREAIANLKAAQAALETAKHQPDLYEHRRARVGPRVACAR